MGKKAYQDGQLHDRSRMKSHEEPLNEVTKYDAMVIYGNEEENVAFAKHLIQRLESLNNHKLNIFVPQHDKDNPEINVFQRAVDYIENGGCKKVIAVLSESFFNDPINQYLSNVAIYCSVKTNGTILLPVIIGNNQITNMPATISSTTKLKYDPKKTYVNFWKVLMKSFDIYDLTQEDTKMDFECCTASLEGAANINKLVEHSSSRRKTPKIKFPFISMIMRKSHPYKK